MENYGSEIPRGQMSTIILSALLSGDKYGYEIIEEITKMTNGKVVIKQPTLYSTLKKLETQKLISTYVKDSDIGGKRRYSRLTDFGKKQVEKWKEDLLTTQKEIVINEEPSKTEEEKQNGVDDGVFLKEEEIIQTPVFAQQETLFVQPEEKTQVSAESEPADESKSDTYLQYNLFDMGKNPISTPHIDAIKPTEVKINTEDIKVIPQHDEISDKINAFKDSQPELSVQSKVETKEEPKVEKPAYDITEEIKELRKDKKSYVDVQKVSSKSGFFTDFANNKENEFKKLNIEDKNSVKPAPQSTFAENTEMKINTALTSEAIKPTITKIKDDAVFITEKTDPDLLPHVKKIEPTKLHILDIENSELKNKILEKVKQKKEAKNNGSYKDMVSDLYQKGTIKDEDNKTDELETNYSYFNSYDALKKYYDTNTIFFGLYRRRKDVQITNSSYVYSNKVSLVKSSIMFFISIVMSLCLYFGFSYLTNYGTCVYLILPCIFLLITLYRLYDFTKNKDKKLKIEKQNASTYFVRVISFVLISMLVLAINLLIGMTTNNIIYFFNTLIYPMAIALLVIIDKFVEFLTEKIKAFRV